MLDGGYCGEKIEGSNSWRQICACGDNIRILLSAECRNYRVLERKNYFEAQTLTALNLKHACCDLTRALTTRTLGRYQNQMDTKQQEHRMYTTDYDPPNTDTQIL